MTTISIKKGTFKHIESELFAYNETKAEIKLIQENILHGKAAHDENIGGGRSSYISDPTARTAVLLVNHKKLEQLQYIVDAIDTVFNRLPEEKQNLIKLWYWTKPQVLTWDGVASKLHISRRTAINWRNEIIFVISDVLGWR